MSTEQPKCQHPGCPPCPPNIPPNMGSLVKAFKVVASCSDCNTKPNCTQLRPPPTYEMYERCHLMKQNICPQLVMAARAGITVPVKNCEFRRVCGVDLPVPQ